MFNLARLFSFTRSLETQLSDEQQRRKDDLQRADDKLGHERELHDKIVARLSLMLDSSEDERRYLQDRLLPRAAGVAPIYEPSPGEAKQQADQAEGAKNQLHGGPRERVQQVSQQRRGQQMSAVEREVAQYVKDHPAGATTDEQTRVS